MIVGNKEWVSSQNEGGTLHMACSLVDFLTCIRWIKLEIN